MFIFHFSIKLVPFLLLSITKAMEMAIYSLSPFIFIFVYLLTGIVEGNKYEIQLLNSILNNYDRRSRPVEDYYSPLNITLDISLQQLLQVDEKHQTITTNIWRSVSWNDCSLKWNPDNYGNISHVGNSS